MKKILYMSCHEILEYDELKILSELGYECYSLGAYTQPGGDEHRKRPPLKLPYNPHFVELSLQYDRRKLHPEQLEDIDIVIIMHDPSYIGPAHGASGWDESLAAGNWPLFKDFIKRGGRVIWRSIGQSIPRVEKALEPYRAEGLEIVRYSPREQTIEGFVGADAVIRFYKDPEEYKGWTGINEQVINFTQSLKDRGRFCGYDVIKKVFSGIPCKVYGPGNDNLGSLSGGMLKYEDQLKTIQESRVYFYHGTYPASYTLSIMEAMMTGIPIVCVGDKLGNSYSMFPHQSTYEVHEIVQHEKSGFVSNDPNELKEYIKHMQRDKKAATDISKAGRARAIEVFGKTLIKDQWKAFLG